MKRHKPEDDPFERIREWQDHRYDPGYFTGGRISPFLTGGRPNRYGWVLLISGIFYMAMILFTGHLSDLMWWQWILLAAYLALLIAAGVKLLKSRRTGSRKHRS